MATGKGIVDTIRFEITQTHITQLCHRMDSRNVSWLQGLPSRPTEILLDGKIEDMFLGEHLTAAIII